MQQNLWKFHGKFLITIFFFLEVAPSIVSGLANQTLNETQTLRLVCIANGNPKPLIAWSKTNDPTTINSIDDVVTVQNVNKTASGVYQCRASNGIGEDAIALSTVTVNCKLQIFHLLRLGSVCYDLYILSCPLWGWGWGGVTPLCKQNRHVSPQRVKVCSHFVFWLFWVVWPLQPCWLEDAKGNRVGKNTMLWIWRGGNSPWKKCSHKFEVDRS